MLEVIFSDGHTEQVGHNVEWLEFLEQTHNLETDFYSTITSDMYETAIADSDSIDLPIAERISMLLTVAKENDIESVVFV